MNSNKFKNRLIKLIEKYYVKNKNKIRFKRGIKYKKRISIISTIKNLNLIIKKQEEKHNKKIKKFKMNELWDPLSMVINFLDINDLENCMYVDNFMYTLINFYHPAKERILQILFILDVTGSMQCSIDQCKNFLTNLVPSLEKKYVQKRLQFGTIFYSDYDGKNDIIRKKIGTPKEIVDTIRNKVIADGGGDVPEALRTALFEAGNLKCWKENVNKLALIITDASMHSYSHSIYHDEFLELEKKYLKNNFDIIKICKKLKEKKIKLLPIGISNTLSNSPDNDIMHIYHSLISKITNGIAINISDSNLHNLDKFISNITDIWISKGKEKPSIIPEINSVNIEIPNNILKLLRNCKLTEKSLQTIGVLPPISKTRILKKNTSHKPNFNSSFDFTRTTGLSRCSSYGGTEYLKIIKTEKENAKINKTLLIPNTINENFDSFLFQNTINENDTGIFGMNRHQSAIVYSTPEHTMELLRQTSAAIDS